MNKQTRKTITEIQKCWTLKQETVGDAVWVGDTTTVMSFFDKYLSSKLLNDRNPALRESLGRAFQAEDTVSSKPWGENELRGFKKQKEGHCNCGPGTSQRSGRHAGKSQIKQILSLQVMLGFHTICSGKSLTSLSRETMSSMMPLTENWRKT